MAPVALDIEGFLGRTPLGKACPPEDLGRLARVSRRESFAGGDEVGFPGDLWLRCVESGVVGLVVTPLSGRPVLVEILEPGDLFGPLLCAAALPEEELGLRFQALTAVSVVALPQEAVQKLLRARPAVLEALLLEQRRRFGRLVGAAALAAERIEHRLMRLLLRLSRVLGPEVPLTKRALALAAGTTTESVIRTLAPLARAGWIASRRGAISVLKPLKFSEALSARRGERP